MNSYDSADQVIERLKGVVGDKAVRRLAQALGISPAAWAMQRKRNGLPLKHIESFIEREGLNPDYIWKGSGTVYALAAGDAWIDGLRRRLSQVLGNQGNRALLTSVGYRESDLDAVAAGSVPIPIDLLRQLGLQLGHDLNALICDLPTLTFDEKDLLAGYRRAPSIGKVFILRCAGVPSVDPEDQLDFSHTAWAKGGPPEAALAASMPAPAPPAGDEIDIDVVRDYNPNYEPKARK